jgi:hypothetical protein
MQHSKRRWGCKKHRANCACPWCKPEPTLRLRAEAALKDDPDRPYAEIAREIGVTVRTVRGAARSLGFASRNKDASKRGARTMHQRWHVQRGQPNPECPLCREEAPQLPPP